MYYATESRITAMTTIRRERLLPASGKVLVSSGDRVAAAEIVAQCQLPGQIRVVDVSRELGIRPEQAASYMRKFAGESVSIDEVLAAPSGPLARLRKSCRSPVKGEIIAIRGGRILIESDPSTFELRAHITGKVTNVMPNRGVVISAAGTLIQGVWGSGGEAEGVLKLLTDSPKRELRTHSLDVSCHGTIVVSGRIRDPEALAQAIEARVRGIVVGSAPAHLIPHLKALPIPVLFTEGFGDLAMSQQAFALLQSSMGREAMLSADTRTRRDAKRPELLIPLRDDDDLPLEETTVRHLRIGDQVRLLRAPRMGAIGTVADLSATPMLLESGSRLPVALVELENGDEAFVPLANVELIY